LFYTHSRYIGRGKTGIYFELIAVFLIVLLYNLRTGTLPAIICLSMLNCIFDRQRWLIHSRVLLGGLAAILLLGNVTGFSSNLKSSVTRATDKIIISTSTHLDTQNITYTTTKENSLFEKLKLHEVTPYNFFFAPAVKGALYFLLPLPVNHYVSLADRFHKMGTIIYFTLFPLLLVGIFSILKNRTREELYLLAVFCLLIALILGAGPILVPRYRIMVVPFFLLIAMLGASRVAPRFALLAVGMSIALLIPLIIWYDNLYGLLQSIV